MKDIRQKKNQLWLSIDIYLLKIQESINTYIFKFLNSKYNLAHELPHVSDF